MILEAATRNYIVNGMAMADAIGVAHGMDDLAIWWTGLGNEQPSGVFSCAMMTRPDPGAFLVHIERTFQKLGLRTVNVTVDVSHEGDMELETRLLNSHYKLKVELPVMVMELDSFKPSSRQVPLHNRPMTADNFLRVLGQAYGQEFGKAMERRLRYFLRDDVELAQVRSVVGGSPHEMLDSVALTLTQGGVAGVYCVGTSPLARGYGGARMATEMAIQSAIEHHGAELAVLTASRAGEGLYRKMGFREVTRYRQYGYNIPEDSKFWNPRP